MTNFSLNYILSIEQVLGDLAAGIPIVLDYANTKIALCSIGATSEKDLNILKQVMNLRKVIISKHRAKYLNISDNNIIIDAEDLTYDEIVDICGINNCLNKKIINFQDDDGYFDNIIMSACYVETIPAFFMFELKDFTAPFRDGDILLKGLETNDLINSYHELSRAQLKLRYTSLNVDLIAFKSNFAAKEHYAIIIGNISNNPLVRLHSSCYTGDLLGSITCDCQDQLHSAIIKMSENGGGIILYLMQEGRGIGLANKLRCYDLQNNGLDTVEANIALGFPDDARIMWPASQMLKLLDIENVKLLTNNPKKSNELEKYGIKVTTTVPHITDYNEASKFYMDTKANKMGHKLT